MKIFVLSNKFNESCIPSSGGLFESLERFCKFEDMIYKTKINEPFWLVNNDFLIQETIEKSIIHIHLVELEL